MDVVQISTPGVKNYDEGKDNERDEADTLLKERTLKVQEKITKTLKSASQQEKTKVQKHVNSPLNAKTILLFLSSSEHKALLVLADKEQLTITVEMPADFSSYWKVLYFIKSGPGSKRLETNPAAGSEDIIQDLTFCELSQEPLQHLEMLIREIYLPLIGNPANQSGIGEVQAKEIQEMLHGFLANVSITLGQTEGRTCLPLPVVDFTGPITSKDKIHFLEGAVISWTKQIKRILKQDPEKLLKHGSNPTPDKEIEFWKSKAANLNSIFTQLQGKKYDSMWTSPK